MHFTIQISQRLNKLIRSLHQKKFRDQNSLFIAEGERLCRELIGSRYVPELAVIRDYPSPEIIELAEKFSDEGLPVYTANKTHFDQMAGTKSPQGILTVINMEDDTIDTSRPFIALDAVADPGNIGTIIRTAEWFGIDQIILGRDCADKYNSKTVRASMGAIFKSSIVHEPDLKTFISENYKDFEIFGASLDTDKMLTGLGHDQKFGIIFGNEANGISPELEEVINTMFRIEGNTESESLNVSVAVGISLYHFASNGNGAK